MSDPLIHSFLSIFSIIIYVIIISFSIKELHNTEAETYLIILSIVGIIFMALSIIHDFYVYNINKSKDSQNDKKKEYQEI